MHSACGAFGPFALRQVYSKRTSGAKLIFYDLRGDGHKLQVLLLASEYSHATCECSLSIGSAC